MLRKLKYLRQFLNTCKDEAVGYYSSSLWYYSIAAHEILSLLGLERPKSMTRLVFKMEK